jgi:hypothetical protein
MMEWDVESQMTPGGTGGRGSSDLSATELKRCHHIRADKPMFIDLNQPHYLGY